MWQNVLRVLVVGKNITYLRSTMGQDRLAGLALLQTHYDMIVNIDDIIKIFAETNSRRIVLPGLGERGSEVGHSI